ncbi:tRNA (adenosine(37)-N6)-dimethylallyltransferase MiaA [Litoreibacter arenae]|uniref:tRNA dimethylallyltransferase n=1 Tax=Litoreibacter arenae DSM 19593 TaxID=1123360 RepID=S9RYJ0_9RHOB|nr:tRNA (adenosine(37)-N6)-dimethylallyltransferase MiaA [Litoreibacter arenae]EPX79034.1 tRNA delta(2)-isopentenylpyrophosphate transferase [Litoreibacter arenae DSM 19593]
MTPILDQIDATQPVLIAGPTASGKSALALHIATTQGGTIVNADALQVFDCWRVLSARPDDSELAQAPHALYGHISYRDTYSTGHWLRDVTALLDSGIRPIIVGGTGLNFMALTQGLADIPPIPANVRQKAEALTREDMLAALDAETTARIDTLNRARVQRAWEVLETTGRSITSWQADTPPPTLRREDCAAFVLNAPVPWLDDRITRRFDLMLQQGALDEVRALQHDWDIQRPSAKAIGGPELMAHLTGEISLDEARERAIIASRQYAKRQRTWFRARMKDWAQISADNLGL